MANQGVSMTRPGGMDSQVSLLSTTAVIRYLLTRRDVGGDVRLEGGVAALVAHDFAIPHPDRGAVGSGVEAEHNALVGPAAWHPRRGLIPHLANVVMK